MLLAGCQQKVVAPVSVDGVTESAPEPVRIPTKGNDSIYRGLANADLVIDFYRRRGYRLAWTQGERPLPSQDSLRRFVREIRYYGLLPGVYHKDELADSATSSSRSDVLLTDAFLSLTHDLRNGRQKPMREKTLDSLRVRLLEQALSSGAITTQLMAQQPPFEGYRLLVKALRQMLDSLAPVHRQHVLEGRMETLAMESNIRTLENNLERWRRERSSYRGRYILINIPSFMLYVMKDDSVLLASRVIVGEPDTPTPELSSRITRFVVYPYWHVPRKIAINEYLPAIQADSTVISRNHFDVLDSRGKLIRADSVPWATFTSEYFPVSLRQREGSENALGVLKFEFNNPYAVFLHDTNARRLFQKSMRAFSHGCIRMEKAELLAHYLVTGNFSKKSKRVDELLVLKEKHVVPLTSPIPIYVRYYTAEVRQGRLMIYPDLYQKDGVTATPR